MWQVRHKWKIIANWLLLHTSVSTEMRKFSYFCNTCDHIHISGRHTPPSSPPVPNFPRTVPRTASLPQPPPPPPPAAQRTPTPDSMGPSRGFGTLPRDPTPISAGTATPLMNTETATQTGLPGSASTDR